MSGRVLDSNGPGVAGVRVGILATELLAFGDGNDLLSVVGAAGDDVLDGGLGNDVIDGSEGFDTCTGGGGADSFFSCP